VKAPLTPAAVLGVHHRTGPLLVTALLGHLLLVSTQVNRDGATLFESVVFAVMGEVQRVTSWFAGGLSGTWNHYVALQHVQDENSRLRAELGQTELRLQEQRALALRGERLQALLGLQAQVVGRTIVADVVAGDATSWFRTVTIGRGTSDGIVADLAVISPRGVVGRVIGQPSPGAARVQLLVDRNAAAGALIERSRAGGVVVGDDGVSLRMEYVSNLADVQVGDVVVSSGLDSVYPRGLPIGEVVVAERGTGLYRQIRVKPAVDFSALEEVLVVVEPGPQGPAAGELPPVRAGGGPG
jgi:rod shape-determining protein MreC